MDWDLEKSHLAVYIWENMSLSHNTRKPIAVFQHTEHDHLGLLASILKQKNLPSQTIRMDLGESIPPVSTFSGAIILGGPMGVHDEEAFPWLKEECQAIQQILAAELPTLGICLGGQLIAKVLNTQVAKNSVPEIGWHPVQWSKEIGINDSTLGPLPHETQFYHWHYDTFEIPIGAEHLGESEFCKNQGFRIGRKVYGLQFHPEVDPIELSEWLDIEIADELESLSELHPRSVQPPKEQIELVQYLHLNGKHLLNRLTEIFRQD